MAPKALGRQVIFKQMQVPYDPTAVSMAPLV